MHRAAETGSGTSLAEVSKRLFAIDLRALAAFRISLGAILFADTLHRHGDLVAHYSDAGVLPREALHSIFLLSDWHWSLHLLTGSSGGLDVLFGLAALSALALTLGYRTRAASVVSWVLLASLHSRNPLILYGGDHLLRMLLFWALFLPLAERWSLDRKRGAIAPRAGNSACSVASAAILIQMFLLYFFSGLSKHNELWFGGEAMQLTLSNAMFSKALAQPLLDYPVALSWLSRAVPWLEVAAPLLLFVPVATLRWRLAGVSALAGFHLGVSLTLETGIFQWVSCTGLLLFLPSRVWDFVATRSGLRFLRAEATAAEVRTAGAQEHLPPLRNPTLQRCGQAALFVTLLYVIAWNIATVEANAYTAEHAKTWLTDPDSGKFEYRLIESDYGIEQRFGPPARLGRLAKLHQHWAMFQKGAGRTNGWHVVVGRGPDGVERSLLEGGRPYLGAEHPRPEPTSSVYPNARWRTYWLYLRGTSVSPIRGYLPGVLSRDWNRRHPDMPVDHLRIFFLQELPGKDGEPARTRELHWFEGPVPN